MFEFGGGHTLSKQSQTIEVPQFTGDFKTYMEGVNVWRTSGVEKGRQGLLLWLVLPRNHPSYIKELIMSKMGREFEE